MRGLKHNLLLKLTISLHVFCLGVAVGQFVIALQQITN